MSTELDTAGLEGESATRLEQAVNRLLTTPPTSRTPHPDAFEYEITVPDGGKTVVVGEHELPSELQPLTQRLAHYGQVEPRSRPD